MPACTCGRIKTNDFEPFLKDYYKILGVAANATLPEIKKAYRQMVMKYHPDKNLDNPLITARFHEIQEAYETLSSPGAKQKYDEERYFSGLNKPPEKAVEISPEWLLGICQKLHASLLEMDTRSINYAHLQQYILMILTDAHMGVLMKNADQQINRQIIDELLAAADFLEYNYLAEVVDKLNILCGNDVAYLQKTGIYLQKRKRNKINKLYQPFFVLIITLLLLVMMYLFARL